MSVDSIIKTALDKFGDPVERAVYHGEAKRYYTFNYTTLGECYSDDAPQYERYLIQVHFFAPLNENILARVEQTKQAMFAADCTYPETYDSSDDEGRHIVFECETSKEVDYGEI